MMNDMDDSYGKCRECKKFGTQECPPSSRCLRYNTRPYFEPTIKETHEISDTVKYYILFTLLWIVICFILGSDGLRAMI